MGSNPTLSATNVGMRFTAVNALLVALLFPITLSAQHIRDDWRYLAHPFDLEARLDHTLADAPLTAEERAEIVGLIYEKTNHDSLTDAGRQEERRTLLSSRVGSIALAEDGSKQIVVRGPKQFCGANMNCSIWIFVRREGKLRLELSTGGNTLVIKRSSAHGFHDIAMFWHLGADEGSVDVYRWDGAEYRKADCYIAKFDLGHPDKPPLMIDCPTKPQ